MNRSTPNPAASRAKIALALAAAIIAFGRILAYDQYSQNGGDATYCGACHGDFRASPYTSLVDGQSWGNDLHDVHRNTMLGGDCNTCHSGSSRFPVRLAVSSGGSGLAAISCMGCHGRSQDGAQSYGAGLRQHHFRAGQTVCANCHTDCNPANKTVVGENVLPPYYASPGTGHSIPTNPCNPSPTYTENYAGSTLGLDNDGDDLFDQADPDCGPSAVCGNGRVETGEQCDDGNTVSGDCCSSTCQFESVGSPCNDGLFCTVGETCNGSGACGGGTPRDCSDAFSCTTDSCSEATDACVHAPDNAACNDGVFCNGVETCSASSGCQPGTPVDCTDNDICTDDSCNEATKACDHVFDPTNDPSCVVVCGNGRLETGEQCDDGNTVSGDCCSSTCQFESVGSPCNDGLFCTVGEACNGSGACGGGTPRDCSDAFTCTTDSCSEATDACVHAPDNAACNDGVFCNGVETCSASSGCQPGTPVDCTDNDICTDDSCNEATKACDHIFDPTNDPSCVSVCGNGRVETGEQCDDGNTVSGDCCSSTCQFDAAGAPCNDGLFCTVGETCNGSGACGGGTPRDCSDAFSCTTDSCSEATDACVHTPDDAACSDGVFCNGVETCSATLGCQAGTPVDCNDNDICTDDACNESAQRCDHVFDATNAPGCGGTVTWPAWRGPLADSRYAGSQACAGCHPAQYQSWAGSLHARMLIPPGNAQAAGFVLPDNNSVPGTTISITSWSDVLFVVGEKWKTLYVDRTGQIQRAQWNYATGQWNSHPGGPYDCGACHTTGYNPAPTFTDPAGQPVPGIAGTWVEYNIGCEACHGPGAEHAAAPTNSNINRIVLDWTATGEGTRTPSIRSAEVCGNCHYRSDHSGTLDPQRRSESQFNDWLAGRHSSTLETTTLSTYCAKCHSPGNATADSEEHYFSYFDPKEATHVACVSCHDPHGASNGRWATLRWPNGGRQDPKDYPAAIARYRGTDNNPATSDYTPVDPSLSTPLCTDCHKTQPGFRRHVDASPPTTVTLHPPANFGQPFVVPHMEHIEEGNAQCVSCHMPYSRTSINPDDVRTHSFVPNEVEIGGSVHYSVTCGQCHDEAQDCVWCHGEFARRTVNTPAGNAPGRGPGKREHASPVAP